MPYFNKVSSSEPLSKRFPTMHRRENVLKVVRWSCVFAISTPIDARGSAATDYSDSEKKQAIKTCYLMRHFENVSVRSSTDRLWVF